VDFLIIIIISVYFDGRRLLISNGETEGVNLKASIVTVGVVLGFDNFDDSVYFCDN